MEEKNTNAFTPQIKICGLTDIGQARVCVDYGVDAVGFVFYKQSPRYIAPEDAREISMTLPWSVDKVGVFVNESFEHILHVASACALTAVQLHGQEAPELAGRLKNEHLIVIKALFAEKEPNFEAAASYEDCVSAFLVECGKGALPGGNAKTWNWEAAKTFARRYPAILAGGLSPENVCQAIGMAEPDAVDVSSGVEKAPGDKDMGKVRAFMDAVFRCKLSKQLRRVF